MYRKFLAAFAISFLPLIGTQAAYSASILNLRDKQFDDHHVVFPESFETDVVKMQENWYLRNFAVMDQMADKRSKTPVPSEEEIITRLAMMPTTIEMPYNKVVRQYIDMYTQRKRSLVETMLGMSLYYMPIFEQALDRYGLPIELKYLPVIESALKPDAVSRAGATGLWQFMYGTAQDLGVEINSLIDQRRDPFVSSDAAARYLKDLYRTYGDWSLAIASYNCGPGNVNKAMRRVGGSGKKDFWTIYPYLPQETRGYVPAFIAANYVMTYYPEHGISPALARRPIVTDTVHVNRRVHLQQISEVLDIPMDALRILNPQFRQDVIPGDIKPYSLVLPSLQTYCYIASEDSIVNHNADLYARRLVVEPNDGSQNVSQAPGGEWVEEVVTKYHKVRRGENLASIAKRYGVSQSSIRKSNGIGKKVRRGQTLRINTITRRYVAPDTTTTTPTQAAADSAIITPMANPAPIQAKEPEQPKPETKSITKPTQSHKKADTKHTIRKGDTLHSIAKANGTTVEALKAANGLKDDNIREGQSLVIPGAKVSKGGSTKANRKNSRSAKNKKRRSRRR